jgi:WD40 repeat protein
MRPSEDAHSGEHRRALVVGVNQAREAQDPVLHTLLHAADDARAVAEALHRYGGFEIWGAEAMVNEQATARAVQEAIIQLEEKSTPDDLLVFYFSGHGLVLRTSDDVTAETVARTYLATWDFSEPMARRDLRLSLRWLRENLYYSSAAGKVVIILDSCYAGDLGREGKPFVQQLRQALNDYFGEPPEDTGSRMGGLRQALLATGHAQTTREEQGRGLMTTYLLRTLQGEADEAINPRTGAVTLAGIQHYFEKEMPPGDLATVSGGSAGQIAVLALHEQRARELRVWQAHSERQPYNYLPFQRDTYLQMRTRELEGPASLFALLAEHRLIGLVGRRGVGKSWLGRELAFRCEEAGLYPGGIFWMSSGKNDYTSCVQELEYLARRSGYLPPGDDGGRSSGYEEQRARHFCRYLAHAERAFLLIHNLEHSNVLQTILPDLAGGSLRCAIVYTALPGAVAGIGAAYEYPIDPFDEPAALTFLLKDVRPAVLARYEQGEQTNDEVCAAREICQSVDNLLSPLVSLRTRLQDDPELPLVELRTVLRERGVLNGIGDDFKTFWQSNWEDLTHREQQDFLLLACLAETSISLWLLELAAGWTQAGGHAHIFRHISVSLERLGWLEIEQGTEERRVIVGQAQKEFGEGLLQADPQRAHALKAQAARYLVEEFTDGDRLQQYCQNREMYWHCLTRQQQARQFAQRLDEGAARAIESVERCLDQGSALLVQEKRWTETLPELFYQYLHNWSVERETPLSGHAPARWIRLERAVGNEDRALLRTLGGHSEGLTSVAFSPDGREILTTARDHSACLWEAASGRLRFPLLAHTAVVTCGTFSPDSQLVITGARDGTLRVWDRQSGALKHTWHRHMAGITCLACSLQGLLVAGSNDGRVSAGGLTDETVTYWQTPMNISALALAAQRGWILVASGDTIWLQEQSARRPARLWQCPQARITHLALSSDERLLAWCASDRPRVINLWDCERRVIVQQLRGHSASLTSLAFLHGQPHWLLSGADDATARLWDAASGTCLAIVAGHTAAITSVASSPDRRLLVSGSREGAAHVWDQEMARQTTGSFNLQHDRAAHTAPCQTRQTRRRVLLAPRHDYALVIDGACAQLWSTARRAYLGQLDVQGATHLAFATHADLLFVQGARQKAVYTWSNGGVRAGEQTADEVQRLWDEQVSLTLALCEDPLAAPQGIVLPGNPRYRLVCCGERRLGVMDTLAAGQADEASVADWSLESGGPITHLSFSPDGRLLAVGDQRGYLLVRAWEGYAPGPLVGLYKAAGQVAALGWRDGEHILLVDISPSGLPPHFHWLHLQGMDERGQTADTFPAAPRYTGERR